MTDSCPDAYVALANRAADLSGAVIRQYFRQPFDVEDKADASPVTVADKESESAIRDLLAAEVPGHGIFGEEHGARDLEADYVWVIDPIDGTRAFVCGQPTFGTLIALARHGRPILGVIDQPVTGERWVGAVGHGALFNGTPVRTRACPGLDRAFLHCTDPILFSGADRDAYDRLEGSVKLHRYGLDCYAYALIAAGHVDLVCEAGLKPYDYMAPAAVIENAGGVVTDWTGRPLALDSDISRVIAAGDAAAHEAALRILAKT